MNFSEMMFLCNFPLGPGANRCNNGWTMSEIGGAASMGSHQLLLCSLRRMLTDMTQGRSLVKIWHHRFADS